MASDRLNSGSAGETERAGAAVGNALRPGDVVLVAGDLGTGKTTFVRGACLALGVEQPVTSPSFTIGHRYEGRVPVAHLDLFRLESLEAEDPALLSDYVSPDTIAFVEWPQAAAARLDADGVVLRIRLAHAGGDRRTVEADGDPGLVEQLRAALGGKEG